MMTNPDKIWKATLEEPTGQASAGPASGDIGGKDQCPTGKRGGVDERKGIWTSLYGSRPHPREEGRSRGGGTACGDLREMARGRRKRADVGMDGDEDWRRRRRLGDQQQKNPPSSACTAHKSTILFQFPLLSGSPSPPPILPSLPDLAYQNQPGPFNPYLALPPPEDEIPDLDETPVHHPRRQPPYFDGDKSKYMGFVDLCTTYIGAYWSEFLQDEIKILFILSYLRNEAGTSCAASRWTMNWKQRNFESLNGLKAGVTSMSFLEELQRAFGDSNAEQVAAARLMALRQNR
ncbi:unnamed protein product [Mycena citricolor]|uniref:Retrotransposon gag domain-containing protein n=1 Tax=Mycena citricolor TaxID=2018698 RepID=A0AAD2HI81_9AGAR|nr:unnamed protein product [Mycena citricolor]